MKELLDLRGIITVLNTPFTADDRVDTDSLRRHVRLALEAGVAGFLVPAMASEVNKLDDDERALVVAAALEEAGGAAPVIGGASSGCPGDRLRHARRLIEQGCAGVLAHVPYVDDEQYASEVRALGEIESGFLMIQDWDTEGYGAPVPLIARLFEEVESFRALKVEVVPAGAKYTAVLEATGGRLHVSGGWAVMQMIEALDRGVHAMMPTALHEIYVRIHALYRAGRREDAIALWRKLLPVLAFSNQHLDISVHFFKRLLFKQGVYRTPRVRPPILPFDEYHERIADELIAYVRDLTDAISNTP